MENTQKIALVTGGSRGLGKDMAVSLANKGYNVIITYASKKEEAENTVKEIKSIGKTAVALQLDLRDLKALDKFIQDLSETLTNKFKSRKFDFLINNAGMGATVPFDFKGVYFLSQKCLPLMNDNGCIVNISSGTTRFANPGYSVYASMKGAIETFTKYLAKELGTKGIRANVVAPGPIETDFNNAAIRSNAQLKGMLSAMTPLGRVGRADDIGSVVAFLCSEDAKWINGQRIEVSGGINV